MIDNKKEQEREELHRTIWNMANDLKGSVVSGSEHLSYARMCEAD